MMQSEKHYLVGIEAIDEQHRKLLQMAERIRRRLDDKALTEEWDNIIASVEELKKYTVYHFEFEERLMMSRGHKRVYAHMLMHGQFIDKLQATETLSFRAGGKDFLAAYVDFFIRWMATHILKEDRLIIHSKLRRDGRNLPLSV